MWKLRRKKQDDEQWTYTWKCIFPQLSSRSPYSTIYKVTKWRDIMHLISSIKMTNLFCFLQCNSLMSFVLTILKFDTQIDSSILILPKSATNNWILDRKQYSFRIQNKATICSFWKKVFESKQNWKMNIVVDIEIKPLR